LTENKNVADVNIFDDPWRGAEAYHYYILAQKQFYEGQIESSVITALYLRNYEDIIDPEIIYNLLVVCSIHAGYYSVCSKAFLKLQNLKDKNFKYYEDLTFQIFKR
jgi:WD repeat-containing protein 35